MVYGTGNIPKQFPNCESRTTGTENGYTTTIFQTSVTGILNEMDTSLIINLCNSNTIMKPMALKCLMVFLPLMLQKPSRSSKAKDHRKYLLKRLLLWEKGNLRALLSECVEI